MKSTLRTCPKGHTYTKSSDCPTCPVCGKMEKNTRSSFNGLSAPAIRALESNQVTNIKQLSGWTEKELLALHGFGPAAIKLLKPLMKENNVAFKTAGNKSAEESKKNGRMVDEFIKSFTANERKIVNLVRDIFLGADKNIAEHVKWNSPSFYYTGKMKEFDAKEYKRDIAVLHMRKGRIMLVLPTGARIKNDQGILEGNYTDGRKMIVFKDLEDIASKRSALVKVIREWIKGIDQQF